MKNKYRVKNVPSIGQFSQVKRYRFYGWETIGVHTNGYGEYDELHYDYPLPDESTAIELIQKYAKYNDIDYGLISYKEVLVNE